MNSSSLDIATGETHSDSVLIKSDTHLKNQVIVKNQFSMCFIRMVCHSSELQN